MIENVDWFEVIDNLEEDLFDGDDWLSELLREEPKDGVNVDVEPVESSAPVAEELTLDPSLLTLPTYTNYPRSYTQTFEPRDLPMNHVFPLTLQQSVSTEDEIRFTPSTNSILTPSGSSAHSQSPPRAVKSQKRKPRPDHKADRSDVLTTDLAPKTEYKHDQGGNLQGVFTVSGLNTRVRGPFTEEARKATAIARKRGLDNANLVVHNARESLRAMSEVLKIDDSETSMHQSQSERATPAQTSKLYEWLSIKDVMNAKLNIDLDRHTIKLTQGFDCEVEVTVSKFQPLPGDKTSYPWRDSAGNQRMLELPHYYIADMDSHQRVIDEYNLKSYKVYIQRLLKGKSPLMIWTLQEAIRFSEQHNSSLVKDSLRLWAGSRLTELPWMICGEHTLGQIPVQDLECPRSGTIPIPPIMDTQMDHLVIKNIMTPLRQRILAGLQTKIMEKKRENWYEIYLTTFVLLSNMERQFAQVLYIIDWYGMESRFGTRGNSSVSESFIHSCKTLLAFFHYAGGSHKPLALDWKGSKAPLGIMTQQQAEYLDKTQRQIDREGEGLTGLKTESIYERDMYWCHQLLLGDCKVDEQNDREIDELKEEDYIFH
ncbi:uncharacterized protein FFUJ_09116 [Fusarium fujikuroi IMI 58289]|uniref:Uncharacterized protein n=1 Tax=Gibberella fujikuroi (strain CBS 195.34 / IMI 58289 / NRRL A-6831) TaxID=1279085 RepID=S0EB09_GIBF5|nr:uncharacterized protein FFUJ_09116 [Fusarium fujikuroi IMI 58289]CCT71845.1 uncharacterized protein FFUJ_09116 [Fusarium fujikuroi IMI 58289]SCO02777.1 uncharacterized protein FFM5_08000 [Fusarium fujikuroi]